MWTLDFKAAKAECFCAQIRWKDPIKKQPINQRPLPNKKQRTSPKIPKNLQRKRPPKTKPKTMLKILNRYNQFIFGNMFILLWSFCSSRRWDSTKESLWILLYSNLLTFTLFLLL